MARIFILLGLFAITYDGFSQEKINKTDTAVKEINLEEVVISASNFAEKKKKTKFKKIKPRVANFSSFYDNKNQIIDKGIFIFSPKPNSYTGDDVVEFHVHGSNAVVKYFLQILSSFKNCSYSNYIHSFQSRNCKVFILVNSCKNETTK